MYIYIYMYNIIYIYHVRDVCVYMCICMYIYIICRNWLHLTMVPKYWKECFFKRPWNIWCPHESSLNHAFFEVQTRLQIHSHPLVQWLWGPHPAEAWKNLENIYDSVLCRYVYMCMYICVCIYKYIHKDRHPCMERD